MVGAVYLSVTRAVTKWRPQLVSMLLVSLGLTLVWWMARGAPRAPRRLAGTLQRMGAIAAVMGLWSVGMVLVQHHYYPTPPSTDRKMPASVSAYSLPLQQATGDIMVVGDGVADAGTPPCRPGGHLGEKLERRVALTGPEQEVAPADAGQKTCCVVGHRHTGGAPGDVWAGHPARWHATTRGDLPLNHPSDLKATYGGEAVRLGHAMDEGVAIHQEV